MSWDELYALIESRFQGGKPSQERRRGARQPWLMGVTVWFQNPRENAPAAREFEGVTLNVSRAGVSLLVERFETPGAPVWVRFNTLAPKPTVPGIVKACEYVGGASHRINVEFGRPN